ncbi:hypothetical protein [Nonomuraea gerenzanensis]|uniref:Serine peptidase n=1 Tax=Nonomuraea gerenzanensis TaxID=93944 RepID=A0A1M4E445_9ACTN|nr:hypothetical protein [Nonomuraea gerenzanensis]UBU15809.1 hypothetical protein LCN96_12590 [Nonomuraea gerenzanensis]SBO93597.1 hypothetical protein BN4615_P3111 [Nonomuraea gerenzanensis]
MIVGVHGIGNYRYFRDHGTAEAATEAIGADWSRWAARPVSVAYYAHLLHRGVAQGDEDDPETLVDEERELFLAWVDELQGARQAAQGRATAGLRQAAQWLTEHHGVAMTRLVTRFVREVAAYLEAESRAEVTGLVAERIRSGGGRRVVAHSLGSVAAYEALWAHPELEVDLLITLGSPLGARSVIFDRLRPAPENGLGARPPGVRRWVNLADVGDLVAVPRELASRFTGVEQGDPLTIGRIDFHRVKGYLGCPPVAALLHL